MKKEYRIKKSREFELILKNKKFYTTKMFVLYVKPKIEDKPRIGISVSKKLGNAVVRNKIKRQVRMMVQEIYDYNENFDSVLLIREAYLQESFNTNKNSLESLYKKVKI